MITVDTRFAAGLKAASGENPFLCYQCNKCTSGCPTAFAMDHPPARLMRLVQFGLEDALLSKPGIWYCLGCEICAARCPYGISAGKVMEELKRLALARREEALLEEPLRAKIQRVLKLSEAIATAHNVSGEDNASRLIWSANLPELPSDLAGRKGSRTLYFVGCVSSLFPRCYGIPQAFVQLMELAGEDLTVLGGQEWCCGYPLLMAGFPKRAEELAEHNIAQVRESGAKRLVTTCPSCYHTWQHLYREMAGDDLGFEVLHASQVLEELVAQKRITLAPGEGVATYHDPCDLGRKNGLFDPPRRLLQSIPGLSLVEMDPSRENALCCGGGGNLETVEPNLVAAVAAERLAQARETGAKLLVSACPQCERTFTSAVRSAQLPREERIRVLDIVELVWQAADKGG